MTRLFASTAAAMLFAVTAQPALAEVPTAEVRHGDLDLSTSEGRATLDRRIQATARSICRIHGAHELREMMAAERCYRAALASTRTQFAAAVTKKTRAAS